MRPEEVTAVQKILWLESLVDPELGERHGTLRRKALGLRTIGASDAAELYEQHQLVLAYLQDLKKDPRVRTPRNPSAAMADRVFCRLIHSIVTTTLTALRSRIVFILIRFTGLASASITRLRSDSVDFGRTSFELTWIPHQSHDLRRVIIPEQSDARLCPVRQLKRWIRASGTPNDPSALLFPAFTDGKPDWNRPLQMSGIVGLFYYYLRQIGEGNHGYTITSLRRAYARDWRDSRGNAIALYHSGFAQPGTLDRMLRAEPDWNNLPPSLLDET